MANKTDDDIQIKSLDNWKRGQISYFSKSRTQQDALKTAYNVIFDYDAIVRPRGSFAASTIPDVPLMRLAASTVSTNLITNPSFETNTTGWSSIRATLARVAASTDYGTSVLQATVTSTAGNPAATYAFTGLTVGQTYTISAYVKANLNDLEYIYCYELTNLYTEITTADGGWQLISATGVCSSASGTIEFGVGAATVSVGDLFFIDGVLLEESPTPSPYFDGSLADTVDTDYAWTGTAHGSTSTRTIYQTVMPQPLGCDFPFKRADKTEGLLNVFTDGVSAWIYVLKSDLTGWTKFAAQTFDKTAVVSIDQIAGVVVVGNGIDAFTYYDIASNTVKRLVKVADPSIAPVATPVGFSGTNAIDYYYRVFYAGIGGTTKMTPAVKVSSSTIRDTWNGVKSVIIDTTTFTIDPNAQNWGIAIAAVSTGTGAPTDGEYLQIVNGLPITQKQYTDNGGTTLLQSAPIENTTQGIIASYFKNISGRLWAINNSTGIVYWGGDIGNELYFGSANGSDSYTISSNSIEQPMAITLGRDNAGTTCINLLTRTQAGQGAIWDIYATTNSITANGQTFSTGTYQFKKREGDDGTDAPFSVIRANNNAYYLSADGFKSTGVKPNVAGIQSTDIISSAIRDRVANLAQSNLSKTYSAYFDQCLVWSIAYGSQTNNEIWVYDILHGGIWSIWRIASDCIFRWSSTKSESPTLYIRQGNKLLRYSKGSHTHADASDTFESYIESGLIPFAKEDKLEWVHLLKNIWQFDQAVGSIDLTVTIHGKNGDILKQNTVNFNNSTTVNSQSGWDAIRTSPSVGGRSRGAFDNRSWNESLADLLSFVNPSDKKVSQKVRKNAAYISFAVRCNTKDTYYELSHLSMLYTYIGVGIEFLSQKGVIKI